MAESKYPHKILIVEDEPVMLKTLLDNLTDAGFGHLIQAKDGEEGLMKATNDKPDLVILDIVMPKMNGMQMLKELRMSPAGKTMKVILLTNLNSDDEIMQGIIANSPSYYLVKTESSIDDIIAKVKLTLGLG